MARTCDGFVASGAEAYEGRTPGSCTTSRGSGSSSGPTGQEPGLPNERKPTNPLTDKCIKVATGVLVGFAPQS